VKPKISVKPVFEKLGLKPGVRAIVLNSPADFKVPRQVAANTAVRGEFDLILHFAFDGHGLRDQLARLKRNMKPNGKLWVAWQKGGVTDLNRGSLHSTGGKVGLDGVSECSVDQRWSAMKFMFPKEQRKIAKQANQ
jgi:hypothetical protein